MKKIYYQLKFKQKSPLRVGNGDNERTDSDLLLDGRELPFIPGSSLAGILRSMLPKEDADRIFGTLEGELMTESSILVSDAVLGSDIKAEDIAVSVRDGIAVDDWGMTISGSKYDFQVVETEKEYTCVLEWNGEDEREKKILEHLIQRLVKNGIFVGARTTRGYGMLSVRAKKLEFCFPDELDDWISFHAFSTNAFEEAEEFLGETDAEADLDIDVGIKISGCFSVQVMTSDYMDFGEEALPRSIPLTSSKGIPVVPGTTWAGCFRHHMRAIIRELKEADQEKELEGLDLIFGKSKEAGKHQKSKIIFSETEITGGRKHITTRNAVDRFTQAPKNTGLYTSAVWQGGTGTIHIRVERDAMSDFQKKLMSAALIDLDLGLMSFGGEAGVGRGRAKIEKLVVDGVDRSGELSELRTDLLEVM